MDFLASIRSSDFEGGGCATLTDMYERYPDGNGPLQILDADDKIVGGTPTGYWLLTMDLTVVDGVTLSVHGTSIGGDCDVLRIKSTSDSFHELRAHGGSLSFMSTKVMPGLGACAMHIFLARIIHELRAVIY